MLPCKQQEIYRDFFSPRLSGQIHGPVDKLFQSPGPRIASGSFGKDSAQSLRRLGFVWPKCSALSHLSRVRLAKRRVVHVQTLFSLWFCRWLRLRKLASFAEISLSVGFVWLIRNRAAPTGSSANWRWIHPSGSFGQNRRAAARPSRLFAHTEDCAGSLLAGPSIARSINSARVDASAWESAEAERYEATPITYELPCSWFVL